MLEVFWTILWVFLLVAWIWTVITDSEFQAQKARLPG